MEIAVIGAGISGATVARLLAEQGHTITVIEQRNHIAGNCYDYENEDGVLIQKYGAHIFHTSSEEVYNLLSRFTEWIPYKHSVLGYVRERYVPIPFNFISIDKCFSERKAEEIKSSLIGEFGKSERVTIFDLMKSRTPLNRELAFFVFENVFLHYTTKQWGRRPNELDSAVLSRVPIILGDNCLYFNDRYEGIPKNGFSTMVGRMLNHPNITIITGRTFDAMEGSRYDHIFYSGRIDGFYWHTLGELGYRSLSFEFKTVESNEFQPCAVVNYTGKEPYTRVIEFKHFNGSKPNKTIIAREFPQEYRRGMNEPFYPIPNRENEEVFAKYRLRAKNERNVTFFGRLGDYRYYDIGDAVIRAMEVVREFNSHGKTD